MGSLPDGQYMPVSGFPELFRVIFLTFYKKIKKEKKTTTTTTYNDLLVSFCGSYSMLKGNYGLVQLGLYIVFRISVGYDNITINS